MSRTKKTTLITLVAFLVIAATALVSFADLRQNTTKAINSVTEFFGFSAEASTAPDTLTAETAAEPIFFADVTPLFAQDFSSSATVSSYVSSTPNNGQFDAIGTSGAGTVLSINGGALQFARTANAGSFSRTTDFSPIPTAIMYRLDLTVSANSSAQTTAAVFQVGNAFGTANNTESNANTYARFGINTTATNGTFSLRELGGSTNSANLAGTQTITWVMNNSGATLTYRAPDGSNESLANDTADLWYGTTKAFNDYAVTTVGQTITDLKFAITAGSETVKIDNLLIDPIPTAPTSSAASSITTSNFTANWSAVSGVSGYRVDVATDSAFTNLVTGYNDLYVEGQATNSLLVSGLDAGTPYWYRVRSVKTYAVPSGAEYASGNSASQNPSTTTHPPTLGTYGNTSVALSGNTTVTPSATPANTTSVSVSTTSAFKGTLSADATTGIVRVMNAHPAGTYPVTVRAFGPGGSVTSSFNLTVTDGTPCGGATSFSFAPAATVAIGTGTFPRAVAVGDLNGDGIQDVVSANTTTSNIAVLLGNGSGGFGAAANFAMGFSPTGIALGDMNGDGRLDVITANSGGDVSYRPGAAGGTFGALTNLTVGTDPTSVVIGDFNADGKLDFATANSGSNNVSIRLGDGAGGFAAATNFIVGTAPITVAAGDFNGDGKLDLVTANISSNNVSVLLGNGVGGFAAAVNYAAGTAPISVAAGDLNGDGKQDLAVANQGGLPGVGVLMGSGTGTFGPRAGYPGGVLPAAVAFGDFNNDGKQDIAAGDQNGPTVPILLGDGAGGFESTRNYTVGTSPRSFAVADLNGDGRQDIIAGNSGSNNLSVLLGTCITPEANLKGNGVSIADGDVTPSLADHTDFGPTPIFGQFTRTFTIENTGTGDLFLTQPNKVSITGANADQFVLTLVPVSNVIAAGSSVTFNVDFYPNSPGLKTAVISIANSDADENPYDFAIQGTATASYSVTYDGNGNTGGTAPIDPNSPYTYPATVTVLGNTGALVKTNYTFAGWNTQSDGLGTTYQPADTFSINDFTTLYAIWTPTPPTIGTYAGASIVMSDNGVVAAGSAPTFTTSISARTDTRFKGTLAANPATGAVTVTNAYPSGIYPVTVTAFGLGGSVSTTFNLTVNAAGCGGTSGLGSLANSAAGTAPKSVAVGDLNGDGNQDLVTANSGSANVSVLIGTGSGTFAAATSFAVGNTPQSVAVGDFNGDGRQDIVAANYGSNSVSLLLGNGSGSFAPKTDTSLGGQTPYMLSLADINGDGRRDVVTANVTGTVSILFGTGSGTFTVSSQPVIGSVPVSVAAGDFNNDGKQDLVVAHSSAGYVTVMPGNGDGTFGIFSTYSSGPWSASVAVGDLNGDGKQDLAVANSSAGTISVLAGNGLGGFGAAVPFSVGTTPLYVATADLNGDGNLDLLSANSASNNISVLTGNGSGSFAAAVNYAVGTEPYGVAVGDVNGDGFQDIAASNNSTNNVSVRLGTCMTSVTYNGNGSNSGSVPVDPATYAVGSTVTVLGNTGSLSRNGYDFSGWNTAPDGSGTSYAPSGTFTINANTTLYAKWAIKQYTLTYNGNGNTGGTAPAAVTQNYNTGVSVAGPGSLTRSGYTFGGWNTASDGSGTDYAPASTFTFPAANTTLYAVWVPITYQLTVNAGVGGTINEPGTSPATVDHGSPTTIIAVANVGYTFTNWTVTAGSASIANAGSAVTTVTLTSGNATVQANFAPLTTVQLSGTGQFIGVEGSTAVVTVTRSGVTTGTSTVQYSLAGGTATPGTCGVGNADYASASGTLTFAASETSKTVNVTLCPDAVAESPDETIGVTLASPSGAALGTPATGSIRVIDTDADYLTTGQIDTTAGGTASPYPLPISVSSYPGGISGLTLSVFAMTQNVPDDIDILLVSPDGTRKMVIMSYAGGSQPLSNTSFKFADTATGFVPDPGPITDGAAYKPTNCVANVPDFPAPAPAGPYTEPGCSGSPAATFASVFGGIVPNGVWKVYIRDHSTPYSPLSGSGYLYGAGIKFILAPTAGEVAVGGRVLTAGGVGIRNARVTVSGGDLAQPLTALTGAFGNYRVDGLTAGETYVVTVASKNYAFEVPSRIVTLGDSVADLDFTARP